MLVYTPDTLADWLGIAGCEVRAVLRSWGVEPIAGLRHRYRVKEVRRRWPRRPCDDCLLADERERLRAEADRRRRREQVRLRTRFYRHRRRVQLLNAGGTASTDQIKARIAYYGGRCWMCGDPWEHLDHVIPIAKGGTGWPSNLRPACAFCNISKNATLYRRCGDRTDVPTRRPLDRALP